MFNSELLPRLPALSLPGMWHRLVSVFSAYANAHMRLSLAPFAVHHPTSGALLGHVDRITHFPNGLRVEGWLEGERITLSASGRIVESTPNLLRADVAEARGNSQNPQCGFDLTLPGNVGAASLAMVTAAGTLIHTIPAPDPRALRRARRALVPGFARRLLRATPRILRALRGDLSQRGALRQNLGLTPRSPAPARLDPRYFTPPPQAQAANPGEPPEITLVLPVYNAAEMLRTLLNSLETGTDLPWHLIVVEDCSTDPTIRPLLESWAQAQPEGRVNLLLNDKNLGFVGSANRGLKEAAARGKHVVLLNSDIILPARWASRLIAPLLTGTNVASVTPLSNNAEIFTAPHICHPVAVNRAQSDALDAIAARIPESAPLPSAPTGVGFCMAININALRARPSFDTAFGRGYGEEVDWCQSLRARGWQHLCQPRLFVNHLGSGSFTSPTRNTLVARHHRIITRRYPAFDEDVQRFIQSDPLLTPRLMLALGWLGLQGEVPVYLAHSLGGGAEIALQESLRAHRDRGEGAVVLRVGGTARWRLELYAEGGQTTGETDDTATINTLLKLLPRRRVIYSCAVGDSAPLELPPLLCKWASAGRLEVLIHDYFPLSPSYCLLNSRGHYEGAPDAGCADQAHRWQSQSLAVWREAWGGVMKEARQITVFSNASADLVSAAYPEVRRKIMVAPHTLPVRPALCTKPPLDAPRVIGILGSIGQQKGAEIVASLSRIAARDEEMPRIVVVGTTDPAFPLAPKTATHGPYDRKDIPAIAEDHGITHWLIPSIWPETFSFTTHEALATGLPVIGFDLGAQGETLRNAANGTALPLPASAAKAAEVVLQAVEAAL